MVVVRRLAIGPKTLSNTHKRIDETQEHFLKMYARCGTILGSAKATGISRPTVYAWQKQDTLGFAAWFQMAKEEYRESLEDLARSRLLDPKGNVGSDLLLISQLNARWPERYRRRDEDRTEAAREALDTLKGMARDWKREPWRESFQGIRKMTPAAVHKHLSGHCYVVNWCGIKELWCCQWR